MNGKIEKRVYIQASADVIYRALTEAGELVEWFCDRAESDAREGGALHAQWRGQSGTQRGCALFERLVPGSEVALSWQDDGRSPDGRPVSHRLTYTIHAGGGSTEVRMCDEGLSFPDEDTLDRVSDGWNGVLLELKEHCEERQRAVRVRHSTVAGRKQG